MDSSESPLTPLRKDCWFRSKKAVKELVARLRNLALPGEGV